MRPTTVLALLAAPLLLALPALACGGTAADESAPETLAVVEPTAAQDAQPAATATDVPPEPTATQPPAPTPLPDPIHFSGTGTNITADFSTDARLLLVDYEYSGDGHFAIRLKEAATADDVELVANDIGSAAGTAIAETDGGAFFYEVDSEGMWSITTRFPLHQQVMEAGPYAFTGSGPSASPVFRLGDGRTTFDVAYTGEGHFSVILFSVDRQDYEGLLANDIGSVQLTKSEPATAGYYILGVDAEGVWTVNVHQ